MNKNKLLRHKKTIQNLGYAMCLGGAATFWVTFMMAYFNNYHVYVTVNDYGEAHIEFILLLFMIPVSLAGFVFTLHDLWRNKKMGNNQKKSMKV